MDNHACHSFARRVSLHLEAVLTLLPHELRSVRMRLPQAAAEVHIVSTEFEALIKAAGHDNSSCHQLVSGDSIICAAVIANHGVDNEVIGNWINKFVVIGMSTDGPAAFGERLWRLLLRRLQSQCGRHLRTCKCVSRC